MYDRQSVQDHTQCITEVEKYGPKGQGKASNGTSAEPKSKSKANLDIDTNVGLSSHAPWFCSLCNTHTTSRQTLLLHADGKKHRAKARAFHAKQQPSQTEESTPNEKASTDNHSTGESVDANGAKIVNGLIGDPEKAGAVFSPESEKVSSAKKRKFVATGSEGAGKNEGNCLGDLSNGEVVQAERTEPDGEPQTLSKKKKHNGEILHSEDHISERGHAKEASNHKIKWKKLITSILKLNSDGVVKMKKLRKLVSKALQESGITLDEAELRDILAHKINSSSRFILDDKLVRLASESRSWFPNDRVKLLAES